MNGILALIKREPAVVVALIDALLVLGVTFGLHVQPDQTAAIDAVLAVVGGIVVRSQVSPTP
jgi:hypothetical protein